MGYERWSQRKQRKSNQVSGGPKDESVTYKGIVAGALLIVLLYLALAYGIYTSMTSRVSGSNDLYSRWSGARALFLEGRDPYSSDVTQSIQLGMRARLRTPPKD